MDQGVSLMNDTLGNDDNDTLSITPQPLHRSQCNFGPCSHSPPFVQHLDRFDFTKGLDGLLGYCCLRVIEFSYDFAVMGNERCGGLNLGNMHTQLPVVPTE